MLSLQPTRKSEAPLSSNADEAKAILAAMAFDGWAHRKSLRRVCNLFRNRPEWQEARTFFERAAKWLAQARAAGRRNSGEGQRDYHVEFDLSRLIARFALALPDQAARAICTPLVALVDTETDEAEHFVQDLIVETDQRASDCFWALWQDIADRAVNAPWTKRLDREHPYEAGFIHRLFLNIRWKPSVKHWGRLNGEAHRLDALVMKMPPSVVCLEAYTHFLYTIGQQSLPGAFVVIDSALQRGDANRMASDSEIAFALEALLGRFVYGEPHRLKSNPQLRDAILRTLDVLVTAGSSAAYRMRDDFVTPLEPRAA